MMEDVIIKEDTKTTENMITIIIIIRINTRVPEHFIMMKGMKDPTAQDVTIRGDMIVMITIIKIDICVSERSKWMKDMESIMTKDTRTREDTIIITDMIIKINMVIKISVTITTDTTSSINERMFKTDEMSRAILKNKTARVDQHHHSI